MDNRYYRLLIENQERFIAKVDIAIDDGLSKLSQKIDRKMLNFNNVNSKRIEMLSQEHENRINKLTEKIYTLSNKLERKISIYDMDAKELAEINRRSLDEISALKTELTEFGNKFSELEDRINHLRKEQLQHSAEDIYNNAASNFSGNRSLSDLTSTKIFGGPSASPIADKWYRVPSNFDQD